MAKAKQVEMTEQEWADHIKTKHKKKLEELEEIRKNLGKSDSEEEPETEEEEEELEA